jgi:predicted DNA-binding transcriptional regulator AlpA
MAFVFTLECGTLVGVERFLSVTDIADLLQVSVNTLNGRIRAGTFPTPDAMIGSRYQGWKASTIDSLLPPNAHQAPDAEPYEFALGATALRRIAEEMSAYSYGWHSLASEPLRADRFDAENRLHVLGTKLERWARSLTVAGAWNARLIVGVADGSLAEESTSISGPSKYCDRGVAGADRGASATLESLDIPGLEVVPALLPPLDVTVTTAAHAYRRLADELDAVSTRLCDACRDQQAREKIRTEMQSIATVLHALAESAISTDANSVAGSTR